MKCRFRPYTAGFCYRPWTLPLWGKIWIRVLLLGCISLHYSVRHPTAVTQRYVTLYIILGRKNQKVNLTTCMWSWTTQIVLHKDGQKGYLPQAALPSLWMAAAVTPNVFFPTPSVPKIFCAPKLQCTVSLLLKLGHALGWVPETKALKIWIILQMYVTVIWVQHTPRLPLPIDIISIKSLRNYFRSLAEAVEFKTVMRKK